MRLKRNESTDGVGKYAVVNMSMAPGLPESMASAGSAGSVSVPVAAISLGTTPEESFFVLKLKDQFANAALNAYTNAVYMYADRLAEAARVIDEAAADDRLKHDDSAKIMRAAMDLREYAKEVVELANSIVLSNVTTKLPD